jgi:hypothetical protein
VDGFRFDLADLVGVAVLKDVEAALKRVKPDVVLIAEPWSFRGHAAGELRDTGWASWNDGYRNFLRDYVPPARACWHRSALALRMFVSPRHPSRSGSPRGTQSPMPSCFGRDSHRSPSYRAGACRRCPSKSSGRSPTTKLFGVCAATA